MTTVRSLPFSLPPYFRGGPGIGGLSSAVNFGPRGWAPFSSIRVFLSQSSQKWEFRKCVKIFIPLHSKESGPESMNQEICPLAFIPESITHTHRHRLPFFFLFRPQMDTFPVLYLPLGFPQSGCQSIRFLLGKKIFRFERKEEEASSSFGFFFLRKRSNRDSGRDGTKRGVSFFSGPTLRGFFCGVFSSLPLPTWTQKKEDELCKHFLLEYAAKARQIE